MLEDFSVPVMSRVAAGAVLPMPTFPELIIRLLAGAIVKFPELLEIVELDPPIDNFAAGAIVPIPTFPLFAKYRTDDSPASPPALLWKFRVPLFNKLKAAAGALPVGTAKDRLPEIVAVGFPELTLMKANLALAVEVPPISKSSVALLG